MLPPSDSFLHQSHKLAEVLAGLQNRTDPQPPPPYALSAEETLSNVDADSLEDEPAHPITIHIDASINIRGNGNTVILPSKPSEQEPQNQIPSPSRSRSNTNTNTTSAATRVIQTHRQTKLSELATSIIASLRDSDHLPQYREGGRAPVDIRINAGVRVEGSRNVVCAGAPPPSRARRNGNGNGNGLNDAEGRRSAAGGIGKRRAQSEPPDLTRTKRECRE